MDNRGETTERTNLHRRYARELILEAVVLCIFAMFYGIIWPPLAAHLELHVILECIISISTQAVIGFYSLYQIPRTLRLLYQDWREL